MAAVVIKEKDMGFKRITKEIHELKGHSIKIGIWDEGGGEGNKKASVLEYAMFNEFGTSRIPARPFMQTTYDNHADEVKKFTELMVDKIINNSATTERTLKVIGEFYQMKVQQTIREAKNWAAPNDPKTVELKGSSSPLIDTGRLIGAVRYEIT